MAGPDVKGLQGYLPYRLYLYVKDLYAPKYPVLSVNEVPAGLRRKALSGSPGGLL